MAHRIEISYKEGLLDVPGEKLKKRIKSDLAIDVEAARVVDVFTVDAVVGQDILTVLKDDAFVDPIIQKGLIGEATMFDADWVVEVGYKPGVTDNVGRTAKEVIEAMAGRPFDNGEAVYNSKMYFLKGSLTEDDVHRISEDILANILINRYTVKDMGRYRAEGGMGVYVPKVTIEAEPAAERIDVVSMPIDELMRVNRERTWALSKDELMAVQAYFSDPAVIEARRSVGLDGRPTDVEIEAIAQTWSEHCKHKIFNALIDYEEDGRTEAIDSLFKTYIVGSTEEIRRKKGRNDFCLSVFKDNAGVIKFNRRHNLAFKVETHNTPSALDPYGGALTGIVGVNRDPFGTGKGARLAFNTDVFCFADPSYHGEIPPRLLHPKRVLEGVREGVEHGGNKSGIPTVNGSLVFDENYLGKPLVFCGTCGIMPAKIRGEASHLKRANVGDHIVMVGGRIGKDGIHGATFSSEELSEVSPTSAVQIGDPITQKRMTDFLLIARDRGLYSSITDNGAGGLSSSIGEMATDTNGCIMHLERAPLKYHGLAPWEILLSEAQERMTVAVPPDKLDRFLKLSKKMNVSSTVLGEFTDSGRFHVLYDGKTVGYLSMDFLHEGLPKMHLKAKWERRIVDEEPLSEPADYAGALASVLRRWNVCSKEYVVRQYDHEVQGSSVAKPLTGKNNDGPGNAGVVRPDLTGNNGVVISHGICPKYSRFDTYNMVACAIDEAIRNNIAAGGSLKRMALLDNFCWSDPVLSEKNPEGPYKLAQLVRANRALYDYTTLFGTPCISGKDSMKNDYMHNEIKISVPQTVLVSCISVIDDVEKIVTMDMKEEGDLIIVLGRTYGELGGSEYFSQFGRVGNIAPRVRGPQAKKTFQCLEKAIKAGIIRSCHDISDGGLACCLAESAFAGDMGIEADLALVPHSGVFRDDMLLFSESASRFVVTIKEADLDAFDKTFKSVPYGVTGKVKASDRFIVKGLEGNTIIDTDINSLKAAWQAPFKELF
ncbi:MAG TPA: AIR synthase-related protein [Syntrophorhabdaceae bacterium]|nr:AIR synthase-related protein [Syntrophorhabdaceae bacterium]